MYCTVFSSSSVLAIKRQMDQLESTDSLKIGASRASIRDESITRDAEVPETIGQIRTLDDILDPIVKITTNYSVLDSRLFFIRNMKRSRGGPAAFEFVSLIDDVG